MSKKSRRKHLRKIKGRYIIIEHTFLETLAWRSLPPNAQALYLLLRKCYDGYNNGFINYSQDRVADTLHIGTKAVRKAFKDLQDKGFIVLEQRGHFFSKKAAEWRLTDLPCGDKPPTKDYLNYSIGNIIPHASEDAKISKQSDISPVSLK